MIKMMFEKRINDFHHPGIYRLVISFKKESFHHVLTKIPKWLYTSITFYLP